MAIRTRVPKGIGALRNKVSVNLSDEEKEALSRIGLKENASDAGAVRICMLIGMRELGERVTAHQSMTVRYKWATMATPRSEDERAI